MANSNTQQFEPFNSRYLFSFKWTIEDFFKTGFTRKLQGPEFQTKDEKIWHVTFEKIYSSPANQTQNKSESDSDTDSDSDQDYYFILSFYTSEINNISLDVSIKMADKSGTISTPLAAKRIAKEDSIAFKADYKKIANDKHFKLKDLVLFCEMKYNCIATLESSCSGLNTLSADLKKLFESSVDSDVTFKILESTISAHKPILIARSPVFETMIRQSATSEIEIDDIDPRVFKMLLEYLYTGVCPDCDFVTARALVCAADKYSVLELKQLIFKQQRGKISGDNAVSLLALADLHGDEDTKIAVSKFIKSFLNKIPDRNDVWKIFDDAFADKHQTEMLKNLYFRDAKK